MDWLNSHGLLVLGIYYTISSIISTMPSKAAIVNIWYGWAYDALHLAAANAGRVIPQLRMSKDDREVPKPLPVANQEPPTP